MTSASATPDDRAGAVVHQLGDRAGADRADIAGLVAHRVEHALVAVELLLVAADPDRHLAAGSAAGAAADRRIQHVEVLLGEDRVDLAHHRDRVGRHVEKRGVGLHALDQTVLAERHRLDIGRHRQRGEDDLRGCGELARGESAHSAPFAEKRLGRGAVEVVDDELVAGLLQIGRHALAHHAEPDETDAHLSLRGADRPKSFGGECGRIGGPGASGAAPQAQTVIPGRRVAVNPESIFQRPVFMDSGLSAPADPRNDDARSAPAEARALLKRWRLSVLSLKLTAASISRAALRPSGWRTGPHRARRAASETRPAPPRAHGFRSCDAAP